MSKLYLENPKLYRQIYYAKTKLRRLEYQKKYNLAHRDKIIATAKQWRIDNRERFNRAQNKRRNAIPENQKKLYNEARRLAYRLLKSQRPDTCQICLRDNTRINAHHIDYTQPLNVLWVCNSCHSKIHNENP